MHCSATSTCGGERAICSFGPFCETMNLFGYVSPVRRQLSRVACSIVQNWEASFNPLDAQFSVSHVQYWETSFNPLDVSASVVRSMSVPTKTFLSLSRRVSRDLQSRAVSGMSVQAKAAHRSPLDVSTSVVRSMSVPAKLNRNSSFHFLAMSRPRQCRSGRNGLHRVGRVMNGHVAKWEWNRVVCHYCLFFLSYY